MSKTIMSPMDQAVRRLAAEHPDWVPVLEATAAVAGSAEPDGGEFAGAWVVDELARRGLGRWIPNLRILASYGLIEKSGPSTRGGRRAYYRMPQRPAIEEALQAWRARSAATRKRPSFIASGESIEPPTDLARRVGELVFEPPPWR